MVMSAASPRSLVLFLMWFHSQNIREISVDDLSMITDGKSTKPAVLSQNTNSVVNPCHIQHIVQFG